MINEDAQLTNGKGKQVSILNKQGVGTPFKLEGDLTSHTIIIGSTRSGMAVLNNIAMDQLKMDDSTAKIMRIGRKRNDQVTAQPATEPYYCQFNKRKF